MTFNNSASLATIRKFLKNIINSTINVVHSLSTFKNVNKNNRIKKSNADRFKKDLNNSQSKSFNIIDHLVHLTKISYIKTVQCRKEIVTRHD